MLKVAIIYKIKNNIWGGGNSFLKNLKYNLHKKKLYTDNLKNADIILFNGHQDVFTVLFSRLRYPEKIFIHRFDGPMQDARLIGNYLDNFLYYYNNIIADGTIFQSEFSRKKNINYGYKSVITNKVIHNFVSSELFNTKNIKKNNQKILICCSSFSINPNKGLDDLKILDKKINFNKIEIICISNLTFAFKNIKIIPLINHNKYSEFLKKSDYYLSLSYFECCSNSILEALGTGNIIIYRKNSGNKEIAGEKSLEFKNVNDLITLLNKLNENNKINYDYDSKTQNELGVKKYIDYCHDLIKIKKTTKKYKILSFIKIIYLYIKYKVLNYIQKLYFKSVIRKF